MRSHLTNHDVSPYMFLHDICNYRTLSIHHVRNMILWLISHCLQTFYHFIFLFWPLRDSNQTINAHVHMVMNDPLGRPNFSKSRRENHGTVNWTSGSLFTSVLYLLINEHILNYCKTCLCNRPLKSFKTRWVSEFYAQLCGYANLA